MADPRASRDRDGGAGSVTARCRDGRAGAALRRWVHGVAALAALLVVSTGCTPLDDAMVAIFGRGMRDSRSFDPYENPAPRPENSVPFSAGTRAPAPGAVNIGVPEIGPYVPEMATSDIVPPGSELVRNLENPIETDAESLARGELMYNRYCAVCHGPNGVSEEAPIIDKHPVMAAYNLAYGNPVDYADGYLYGIIRMGRVNMPAYGARIPHFDRWHVVNYVRSLQEEYAASQGGGGSAQGGDAAATGNGGSGDAGTDGGGATGGGASGDAAGEEG